MKSFRRRTWFLVSGGTFAAILIALFVHSFVLSVNAVVDSSYTIRILEITDPTSTASLALDANDKYPKSELDGLQGLANVKIDTMTMKRFVSLRDDWDGKYDAVYIGKGAFNKKKVNSTGSSTPDERIAAHKTTSVENDITKLKAKEITDYYISKGLNVILREETFTQQNTKDTQGVLYETFNPYRTATRTNITFLKDKAALDTFTTEVKAGNWSKMGTLKQRPRLTLTSKPANYSENPTEVFESGDKLDFSIRLDNIPDLTQVRIKLYINVDSSLPVTEDNVVVSKEITSPSDTLSYTLPSTFSGPLYWRIEISTLSGLKDFDTGNILYKGVKPEIKVLQIMPAGKTESDLLSTTNKNMKAAYLNNPDYYKLIITPHDMTWFNNYIAENASTTDKTSGLNGNFDMVVFGFLDMYDRATTPMLSKASADAVKAFAEETKQSLMLTHDTIFREVDYITSTTELDPYPESTTNGVKNYNYWSSYFHDMVGQTLPRTYLGGNAVNTSTKVVPVNQGLLTQYPFNLTKAGNDSGRYTVATTHDQFFPLNLERADVIPWYNISGSERDTDDSYNHFYTYSVGNITFSGTGHTSKGFPDWEQMLFVNTMYRAFTGANHAPKINIYTPQDKSTKPSYQDKLTVSYAATDLDLKDKDLLTSINISKLIDKEKGTYVSVDTMKETTVKSGATFSHTFNNPLHEDGTLKIEITAKDKQGALATETITIDVQKVESNLTISRSLSPKTVEKGEPSIITYNVKPNSIPASAVEQGDQGVQNLEISDIQYSEVFPSKLEFSNLSSLGLTQSGTPASGYTLTKNLGKLTYHLSADGLTYVPDLAEGITFTVKAVPTEKVAHYQLDNSILSFEDLHSMQTAATTPVLTDSTKIYNTINSISNEFVAFILGDTSINSAQTNGRMAVGGNAQFSSYRLNRPNGVGSNALIVGGNFIFDSSNGASITGDVVYGGTSQVSQNNTATKVTPGKIINFNETGEYLQLQSKTLASLASNGSVDNLSFVGSHSDLNIFDVKPGSSNDVLLNNVKINAPQNSTVIINVYGENISIRGGFDLTNIQNNHIVLNFPEAKILSIRDVAVKATILAPLANVQFDSGNIYGTLIAKELHTNNGGTLNSGLFDGTLPPVVVATPTPIPAPVLPRVTMKFDTLSFDSIVKVMCVTLVPARISINTSLNMDPLATYLPVDINKETTTFKWESLNPGIATISDTGIVRGIAEGTAEIKLTVTDISGKTVTDSADVEVMTPELNISGPKTVLINTSAEYVASYNTANDNVKEYKWSIKEGDDNAAGAKLSEDASGTLKDHATLAADKSGEVTLMVVAITDAYPDGTAPKEYKVTFTNTVREIAIWGPNSVHVDEKIELTIKVELPEDADPADYKWELLDKGGEYVEKIDKPNTSIIELKGLKITATDHPVVIKASLIGAPADHPVEAIWNVTVGSGLTDLSLPDTLSIKLGTEHDLFRNDLGVFPTTMTIKDVEGKLLWSTSDPAVVKLTGEGVITGKTKGTAQITVTSKENSSITDTIQVTVTNEDRY
ncbi:DUF5057 domain-containing protein [Paenibacillus sp. FSL R10-2199]|uniref:DUF5057 domain-containing protein n=1 Tax=Paenibacillus sp. FSL R10-2199 TaxID=2975348 RepID=UPI0030F8AA86